MFPDRRLALIICCWLPSLVLVPSWESRGEDWRDRQKRVKSLSPQEKQDLQRREQRFRSLSESEQQRIRGLHQEIQQAPDSETLQAVMVRYHAWLNGLRPGQRADLKDLPPQQRVARIRELLEAEAAQRFHRFAEDQLEFEDRRVIGEWLRTVARDYEDEVLERLSPEGREWIEAAKEDTRERRIRTVGMLRFIPPQNWDLPDEAINELSDKLSPKAREALLRETDPAKRARLVGTWTRATLLSMRGWQPPVPREELLEFFHKHVTSEDRSRMEALPTEQLRVELERRYHAHHGWRDRRGPGADGGSPGPRGRGGGPGFPFGDPYRRPPRPDDADSRGEAEPGDSDSEHEFEPDGRDGRDGRSGRRGGESGRRGEGRGGPGRFAPDATEPSSDLE
jgi:hypothetical protein